MKKTKNILIQSSSPCHPVNGCVQIPTVLSEPQDGDLALTWTPLHSHLLPRTSLSIRNTNLQTLYPIHFFSFSSFLTWASLPGTLLPVSSHRVSAVCTLALTPLFLVSFSILLPPFSRVSDFASFQSWSKWETLPTQMTLLIYQPTPLDMFSQRHRGPRVFGSLSRKLRDAGGLQVILGLVSAVDTRIRIYKSICSLTFVVKTRGCGDLLSPRVSHPWVFPHDTNGLQRSQMSCRTVFGI